jgi:hypothetical protein
MKKILTFCRIDSLACVSVSIDRHTFIPTLQELFIGRLNSQKSICCELETSSLVMKYNIQGWSNK